MEQLYSSVYASVILWNYRKGNLNIYERKNRFSSVALVLCSSLVLYRAQRHVKVLKWKTEKLVRSVIFSFEIWYYRAEDARTHKLLVTFPGTDNSRGVLKEASAHSWELLSMACAPTWWNMVLSGCRVFSFCFPGIAFCWNFSNSLVIVV